MSGGCSVVTISKINGGDTVESSKVFNGIMENAKVILYLDYIDKNEPDKVDLIYDCFKKLTDDISNKCYTKVQDICIEIDFDEPMQELSFEINLLMTDGKQMLDQDFFELCNDLNDKYEEIIISNAIHSVSFDFNIQMKNEYIRTISIERNGL
jgi:hypothetical protein